MEGVRKRLAVGAIWTAGGRIVSNVLGLVGTLALARLLTPDDFGLVAIANVIYAIILAVTELSLSSALIQHKDPQKEHYDTAFTLNIVRTTVIAAILAIASFPIAAGYEDQRLIGISLMLGVTSLVSGLVSPRIVIYRRRLSFSQEIFSDFLNKLVGLLVAVAIALQFQSFWALVIGSLASQITAVVISYILAPYRPKFSLSHWRSLFAFSGWVALSSGINAINWKADQLAVGAIMGNGPLGLYTVGDNLASLPVRESTAPIANVLFPAFSRLQDEPERLRDAYLRSQRLLVATALPIGVGFALVARPFIELVLGSQWVEAAIVGQVLGSIYAVHAFSMPVNALVMGIGRTRILFLRDVVNIAIRYPLIFAGLFGGGLVGLLIARCFSGVAGIAIDMYLARRLVQIGILDQFLANWRSIVATIIMAIAVWSAGVMIDSSGVLALLLAIFVGGSTYFSTTLALWWLSGVPPGPEREALDMLLWLRRR